MKELTRLEKVDFIINLCEKHKITAYEIGKNTSLTNAGAHKILTRNVKTPHHSTLNIIINYIEEKLQKEYKPETKNDNFLNEDEATYTLDLEYIIYKRVEQKLQHKFDNLQKQINDLMK